MRRRVDPALRGPEEVKQAGKISVYRLLDHVTRRVIDFSKQLGKLQHPTLRGHIDGELTWPVFTPGPIYRMAFPERARQEVTATIQSLMSHGFPPPLLDAWATMSSRIARVSRAMSLRSR